MITLSHSGSGRDLVLLPGWGSDGTIFSSLLPALEGHFRVHLGRWHQHTQPALSSDELLKTIREDLIHQLEHQDSQQAIWVGWSLGGLIATDMAQHHPEKVIGLMTIAFNPCFVQQADWSCAMPKDEFTRFQEAYVNEPIETLNRFMALQGLGAVDRRNLQKLLKKSQCSIPNQQQAALLNLLRKDLRPAIAQLAIKQMHCYGELDGLVPASELTMALTYLNPHVQTRCYAAATHLPFISAKDAWLKDLLEWCAV